MVLKKEIALQIKDLLKENPQGLSITDIVKVVNINRNTAGRYLENLLISGQVEMRRLGMAKIYMLSQRVPLSAVLSISSELVMQLDSSLRIIFANESFLKLIGTDSKNLLGKNIEYTPVALVFDDLFPGFLENIREGLMGKEWAGDILLTIKDLIFFCRVAPTVFDDGRKGVSVLLEDITEKKRAEMTLQDSEDRYRKLVEISPDAVFLHREGKIIYANPAAFKLLGASHSDEIIGKNVLDFIHPEFHDPVRKNIEKDLEGDISPAIELHMLRVDGTSIIVEGRGVKTNIEGKPAVQVAIRDITERKHAEEALRESEERLQLLLNSTDDLIFMQDPEGRYLYFNSAARYGVTIKEMLGSTPYDLLDRESADRIMERLKKVAKYGQSIREETPLVWKGQTLWFSDSLYPVRDVNGTIAAVVTISQNITGRKCAEIALRESEEKYRTLVDRANDAICVIQDGILKMCNPRLPEFWGGSVEEIMGRPFIDFIHPYDLSVVIDRYNLRMAGETPPSIYETILKRKDGSRFYAELNAGIVSYEGKPADLVIIRDMNKRKKAEDALRESEATARALMNAPTDSVILMDEKGIILALNETAAVRFGNRSDELVGLRADDLLPEDVARSRRSLITEVLEKKKMVRFEDQRDGSWYDTVAYPILSGTGEVNKIAIIARDITDRRHIEKALIRSEQRFRNYITATGDIIWETDAQARFVYVSPQVETILGYKPDELIGHPPFEFLHPDAIRLNHKKFQTTIERHEKSVLHVSHWIHKDGQDVLLESNAIPLYDSNGSFSGFIGIDRQR